MQTRLESKIDIRNSAPVKAALKWKDLFFYLIKTDLKLSYSNKTLGYIWTLFDPVFMSAVYLFLVVFIFNRGYPGFAATLFASLLVWRWIGGAINQSIMSIPSKGKLLLTLKFPKLLLPLTSVSIPFTKVLFGLVWIPPLMLIQEVYPTLGILWIIPILGIVFILCSGFALFLSILGVYFRDLSNISTVFLRSGFYLSPILYSVEDAVPQKYYNIYMLNPFAPIFDGIMRAIRYGEGPTVWILWPISFGLVLVYLGLLFFKRRSYNIVKDL